MAQSCIDPEALRASTIGCALANLYVGIRNHISGTPTVVWISDLEVVLKGFEPPVLRPGQDFMEVIRNQMAEIVMGIMARVTLLE